MSEPARCAACGRKIDAGRAVCGWCGAPVPLSRERSPAPPRGPHGERDGMLVLAAICAVGVPLAVLLLGEIAVLLILVAVAVILAGRYLQP